MKKIYNNPEIEVVELQMTQQIMAGSPGLGGNYDPSKPVLSPELELEDN